MSPCASTRTRRTSGTVCGGVERCQLTNCSTSDRWVRTRVTRPGAGRSEGLRTEFLAKRRPPEPDYRTGTPKAVGGAYPTNKGVLDLRRSSGRAKSIGAGRSSERAQLGKRRQHQRVGVVGVPAARIGQDE